MKECAVATASTTNDLVHHPDEHLAHHFESTQQQFDAGKLGMWLFLVTEVLFFSGLFVAYAVYRVNHPEVFAEAPRYLNKTLGGLNTMVLLFSSLTMAWAVRCSQLGRQRHLVALLATTVCCASLFLGVKAVEYAHKWSEGLLWAGAFSMDAGRGADSDARLTQALLTLSTPAALMLVVSLIACAVSRGLRHAKATKFWLVIALVSGSFFAGVAIGEGVESLTGHAHGEQAHNSSSGASHQIGEAAEQPLPLTGVFFSIYYAMTGVHAIHILVGIGVILWLVWRAMSGHFGPAYFGPVDFVGLYWHLVDLVWIYLFPLLYLIG